jgi:hypothetical protein
MHEAAAIGARIGCPIAQSPEDRHAITAKLGAFKTSMLQDVQAGRRSSSTPSSARCTRSASAWASRCRTPVRCWA